MKNGNIGFEVAVSSCACGSRRIEDEVGAALQLPKGTVKFVVPLTARLFYDPEVVELGKVVESLKEQGCKVSVDRLQFGIPMRPLFLPQIWISKVDRLSKELPGVIDAAIDFGKSIIAVNYVPALVRPSEIQGALLGHRRSHLDSGKREMSRGESVDNSRRRLDPECVGSGDVDALSFVETRVAQPCRCDASDGMAA